MKKEQSQSVYKLYLYVKDGQSQNNTAYYKYFQLLSYLQGFATQILLQMPFIKCHCTACLLILLLLHIFRQCPTF